MGMVKRGLLSGLSTTWTLGKIIFPVTLIVTLLGYTPLLDWLAKLIAPLMGLIGLPGEAAIPLVIGNVLNLYAGIGAILTFDFTVKEVFILAIMLSFSHNLIIESAVATKVGVRVSVIVAVRIFLAVAAAFIINLVWSGGSEQAVYGLASAQAPQATGVVGMVADGLWTAFLGVVQLAAIVIPLMLVVQIMRERNWLAVISKSLAPLTRLIGVGENTAVTLASGLTIGLAYGAGVMIDAVKEDRVKKKDLYVVFIFLVACHAVVEDTLVFLVLGIQVWPLLVIRLLTALLLTMVISRLWTQLEKRKQGNFGKDAVYDH
ncbi:nucleoside recognition domain-containing protein [Shouchella clausii]|uniref:nucleoside recognition domain-containing protein n=1 Tax=Shouchella clausii TaxID=79880 RepID=UPI002149811B|nr:nucleoside recognition domain-containing protein [Shouchella clausii]MCR1290343.1 nucleoside recognition domain-containing protein [Shouchella clausii]